MAAAARKLVLALALPALAACQKPDVGARCTLAWNQNWQQDGTAPPPTPQSISGAYFESGNLGCDDLVCIVSPAPAGSRYGDCSGAACGYCSKPCVSDRDCYQSDTGLVCAQLVLDPAFLATLDPATRDRYLGDVAFSSYCIVPP
ncbi:MAG TPA: adventurous gliding motility lipoprotein CglC [Anaeromyxobacter sp.]|nr:adventurous gliding motility lipoprotein CglC [Anaeromyxobacter sp.]